MRTTPAPTPNSNPQRECVRGKKTQNAASRDRVAPRLVRLGSTPFGRSRREERSGESPPRRAAPRDEINMRVIRGELQRTDDLQQKAVTSHGPISTRKPAPSPSLHHHRLWLLTFSLSLASLIATERLLDPSLHISVHYPSLSHQHPLFIPPSPPLSLSISLSLSFRVRMREEPVCGCTDHMVPKRTKHQSTKQEPESKAFSRPGDTKLGAWSFGCRKLPSFVR